MMKIKFILLTITVILIYISANWAIDITRSKENYGFNKAVPSKLLGLSLPKFPIILIDEKSLVFTEAISKGRPVVILYFDPYCPHCEVQIHEIVSHIKQLKKVLFLFITPFPNYQILKTYEEFKLGKYENIVVGRDTNNKYGKYFDVTSVPSVFVYRKDLKMYKAFMGEVKYNQILFEVSED